MALKYIEYKRLDSVISRLFVTFATGRIRTKWRRVSRGLVYVIMRNFGYIQLL